jgi:hypothetical protein
MSLFFIYLSYYPKTEFDRAKWLSEPGKRYRMSENMLASKMLIGKTKKEVSMLLGVDGVSFARDRWTYDLGFLPGSFNIDSQELDIVFENYKVIKVTQHQN